MKFTGPSHCDIKGGLWHLWPTSLPPKQWQDVTKRIQATIWWFRNPVRKPSFGSFWNPINNGINYDKQPYQLVIAGFLNHQPYFRKHPGWFLVYSPETNSMFASENRPKPKRKKVVVQTSIFGGEHVSFGECIYFHVGIQVFAEISWNINNSSSIHPISRWMNPDVFELFPPDPLKG